MSVESLIAATEASAASATTTEEPKVAPPTTEVPAEGTQQPVEGQPATETPVPTEPTEVIDEVEPDLDATPETSGDFAKYKDLFPTHPELRAIVGREKAYSELGTFSEVREIVQRIPTVEDAETLASQAENLKTFSETFRGSPAEFAERLQELDQPAFVELVKRLQDPEVLFGIAPEILQRRVENDIHRSLEQSWAHASEEQKAALNIVAAMWRYQPKNAAPVSSPVNSELEKLRKEKAEREDADKSARYQNFHDSADELIINHGVSEIEASIRKAFPQVNDEQLLTLKQRAWKNVNSVVNAQPQTAAQVRRYLDDAKKGRDSLQQQKALVDFVTQRNSKQIPVAVKEAVNWLTKQIISTNATQINNRKAIAERTKDVGTGVQATNSAAATTPPNPNTPKTLKSVWARLDADAAAVRTGATR